MRDNSLIPIGEKVTAGIPITTDEAMCLLHTNDIIGVGMMADYVRKSFHGRKTYYSFITNLTYTNVCEMRCPICAFSCNPADDIAYTKTHDEIEQSVRKGVALGARDVHISGGLNPNLKIDWFEEMLRRIRNVDPDLYIVGFTAAECNYFAQINNMTVSDILSCMQEAGVQALPGGGAEIFSPSVRRRIAPNKLSSEQWLSVMKEAHLMGINTSATMLYNHLESDEDIIDHLDRIRELQNETGGFKTFIPLPYHDGNGALSISKRRLTGFDEAKIFALSRIFLQNVPHLKVLWMYVGEKMAQILLSYGADDLGAIRMNEKPAPIFGSSKADSGTEEHLVHLIRSAGFSPAKVGADYTRRKA